MSPRHRQEVCYTSYYPIIFYPPP
ncbi:hypothetical protein OpiT1DRAFT_05567, partial [Opitutaceae bacterium TAV1]